MQVRLELAQSKANVKRVVLRHDAIIGRSSECHLRIASSLVSRQHCRVRLAERAVFVEDLGSSNGTFVNGVRLAPRQEVSIPPDAQLSLGGVKFVVRFDGPAALAPGSTVDLPLVAAESSESLTGDWTVSADASGEGQGAFQSADSADVEAVVSVGGGSQDDAVSLEPAEDASPALPAHSVDTSDDASEAVADVIAVAADDDLDTLVAEPAVAADASDRFPQFTEDAGADDEREFPTFGVGDELSGVDLVPEAAPAPAPEADSSRKKGGLKSLFGILGRGKKAVDSKPAELKAASPDGPAPDPAPPVAVPDRDDAPAAPAAEITEDDAAGFLMAPEAGAQDEAPSEDESLGDFLKNLGR